MPCAFSKYREALTADTLANCCKGEILLQRKSVKSDDAFVLFFFCGKCLEEVIIPVIFFLMVFGAAVLLRKKQKLRKMSQKQEHSVTQYKSSPNASGKGIV